MAEPRVITFGCRLNTAESELMAGLARDAGLEDTIIVNTCTVTAEATRQARQTIRRAARENPGARIIVTGCAAQVDAAGFAALPGVSHVWGNREKLDPALWKRTAHTPAAPAETVSAETPESLRDVRVADWDDTNETALHLIAAPWLEQSATGFAGRTRAFVQIQQGCDHACTFCIIPAARGPNRSLAVEAITARIRALCEGGFAEVVLTGVDICSYGADNAALPDLAGLVRRILDDVPALPRLRFSSLDPAAMPDTLFALFADQERLMPHLHLSLQAADDMVLKRMKRRHLRADALRVADAARRARADMVLGADLIAGFPTETEAMFENTLSAVDDLGLTLLHVFPYSPRPGTPASRMPAVPVPVRRERAGRLREAGAAALARFLQGRIASDASVLVEHDGTGLSEHYVPVSLTGAAPAGTIVRAHITATDGTRLFGRAA